MGNVAGVQVEEVGRVVVGFDHSQTLRAKKRVRLFASEDREQEGQVRVVGVQQIQLAKVQSIVARDDGKISVQLVVRFANRLPSALVKTPVNSATSRSKSALEWP